MQKAPTGLLAGKVNTRLSIACVADRCEPRRDAMITSECRRPALW